MSILLCDQDKISCKSHKNESCILADINTKGKKKCQFLMCLCVKCLVEQQSNQKLTLIEDTKKLINQMKSQKMEKQTIENEVRRETFKNVLSQIKEFKIQLRIQYSQKIKNKRVVTLDLTFDKMTNFVQQRLFYIQKDIELLQFEGKNNYLEDLTELSRINSEKMVDQKKYKKTIKLLMKKQFEALFKTPQNL